MLRGNIYHGNAYSPSQYISIMRVALYFLQGTFIAVCSLTGILRSLKVLNRIVGCKLKSFAEQHSIDPHGLSFALLKLVHLGIACRVGFSSVKVHINRNDV